MREFGGGVRGVKDFIEGRTRALRESERVRRNGYARRYRRRVCASRRVQVVVGGDAWRKGERWRRRDEEYIFEVVWRVYTRRE